MIKIEFLKSKNKVIALDNNILVGECEFIINNDIWNIVHTYVDEIYIGTGVAKHLVIFIIDEAKKNNKKVVADCSYAKKILMDRK